MSLLEVRDIALALSGRYDQGTVSSGSTVGTSTGTPGMNWFINKGVAFLEKRITNDQAIRKRIGTLAVGEYKATFRNVRVIEDIWLIDETDDSVIELTRKEFKYLRNWYLEKFSAIDTGTPEFWCPAHMGIDPNMTIDEVVQIIDNMDDYLIDADEAFNGVYFLPPTDTALTIEVKGKFYSPALVNNDDKNYWTEKHDNLAVLATLHQIEMFHRNRTGAQDYLDQIDTMLIDIDMDEVMNNTEHITHLEG